ncbi:MAG: PIN domain-containing protein [Methylococcaceae bacterium]|nr:PIN domain-containing protein [Methylococcaceae bacterium]
MKALDTNILVRFLVQDDEEQANKVLQLFSKAEQLNQPLFIPLLVILEVIWVLQSAYNVSRQDIILAISNLLQMSVFEFENQDILRNFIFAANKSSYDLSDILISHSALSATCETTLTFDKRASRFELFTLL